MAPEVWKGEPYNLKSDVWSIGTLMYQLMTFDYPFVPKGRGLTDMEYQIKLSQVIINNKHPKMPDQYSADLKRIVDLCLTKNAD